MADSNTRTAKTTVTTFRIVEALDRRKIAGVTDLAADLGLSKGAVHKHLSTLEDLGYVVQDGRKYRLGTAFLGLGVTARRRLDVYAVARPAVDRLAKATEEVASIVIPEHGYGRYLYRAGADDRDDLPHYDGGRIYLHATAAGKAILAVLPEDRREETLDVRGTPVLTDNTIVDRETLRRELQSVRDTRIAYDRGEETVGWHCIACPILDDGEVVGAVSVSAPSDFASERGRGLDVAGLVGSTATAISTRLGSM